MTNRFKIVAVVVLACLSAGCAMMGGPGGNFGKDVDLLEKHTDVVLLSDSSGKGLVAVLPKMQGRVMTSSANGREGQSYGWINYELIASGKVLKHFNPLGGEDRFWIGPEGGQFTIFFKKGDPFDLAHWYTPAAVDTEPWELVSSSKSKALVRKDMKFTNYSGTMLEVGVDREVRVLEKADIAKLLGVSPADTLGVVAYESVNTMANKGKKAWTKATGLLSIWILGMFNPSPSTTAAIPFNKGPESKLGPIVNDTYFGKVPADRLKVKDGVLFFSHDGKCRSKIGLTPQRAKPVLGNYNAENGTLTIVQYNKPGGVTDYVNSMWEIQKEPFKGDVINSYNDGPPAPGKKPLGPFCELETSSPAAALKPGEKITHIHRTFHLQGPEKDLDPIAKKVLGVTIAEIKSALAP